MLLAGTDLPKDRVVRANDIVRMPMTIKEFKKRFPGIDVEEVLASPNGIVNRRLKHPIKQGRPFLTTDFYLQGTGPSIAEKLPSGYRAIRVQVPATREAGVQAGMYVDVMFRVNPRSGKAGQPPIPEKTVILLQHVEVIDTDRERQTGAVRGKAPKKSMLFTLAVPEEKASMFGTIAGRGEVWLVPTPEKEATNGAGLEVVNAETLAELLGIKFHKPSPPFETVFYRKGKRQVNRFVDDKLVAKRSIDRRSQLTSDAAEPSAAADDVPPAPEKKVAPATPAPQAAEVEELPTAPPAPEQEE